MKIVAIKDDQSINPDLSISEDAIFFGLSKANYLELRFDDGDPREMSNKTDKVYIDTAGTYTNAADFVTNTVGCIVLTGINAQAGFDVILSKASVRTLEAITGGTRIKLNNFSNRPDYLEVSDTVAEITAAFETARQAEVTETP